MSETLAKIEQSLAIEKDASFEAKLVRDLLGQVQQSWNDTEGWRDDRQEDYEYEQGLIGRQNPDLPWPGAPDIRPRSSLAAKRKLMGRFVGAVWKAPHVVKFSGGGAAADTVMEEFYDTAYRYKIPNFKQVIIGAASRLLGAPGNCIFKVSYDYTSRQSTKSEKLPADLVAKIEQIDLQIRLSETQQQVLTRAVELTQPPMPPESGDQVSTAVPEAAGPPPLQQAGQLKELPLLLVAARYGYNLDDEDARSRAEDVLKQIRGKSDVVTAIIERSVFPLKISVVDQTTDLIVPKGTTDVQEAPWVAELMLYNEVQFRDAQASGKFKNVDEVLGDIQNPKELSSLPSSEPTAQPPERQQANLYRTWVQGMVGDENQSSSIPVFEIHCWLRRREIERFNDNTGSNDKSFVRAVVNIAPYADPEHAILRMMEHPNDFEELFNWPYVQIRHFDTGDGFYCGRGLPALNRPFEQEELESFNGAVIRDMMQSQPLFAWNSRLTLDDPTSPDQRRMPGHNIEVNGDPSRLLNIYTLPDLGTPLHADVMRNRQRGNELMGIADTSVLPSYDRPPTTPQVGSVVGPANDILTHEIENWLDGLSKVFQMAHLLMKQYWWSDTSESRRAFTNERTGTTLTVTPADFEHDFIIRAGGEPGLADQQQQAQRAIAWVQLIGINPQLAWLSNPAEWGPDLTAMLLGASRAQKWLTPPQNRQQAQQQFMQMQAQAIAAKTANKQKRQGASEQASMTQMGGANLGNLSMAA